MAKDIVTYNMSMILWPFEKYRSPAKWDGGEVDRAGGYVYLS